MSIDINEGPAPASAGAAMLRGSLRFTASVRQRADSGGFARPSFRFASFGLHPPKVGCTHCAALGH